MAALIKAHRPTTWSRSSTMTIAILAAFCTLFLASAPNLVLSQTQRSVPACIPLETAKPFKWVGQRPEDPNVVTLQAPPATVLLEYNGWASANITGYLSAILLRDVMGVDAKLIEYRSSFNSYPRTAAGTVHVNVEVWAGAKISLYNRYIRQEQTVEDLGLIGYFGKTSWLINSAVGDANPSLIFDSWRSFTQQSVLNFFLAAGTTTAGRTSDNSKWICDPSKYSYCNNNGIFVPPQCQGAQFSSCREFWHIDPSYSAGANEQRIISLGLKLVIVYLGVGRFEQMFAQCAAQSAYGCVGYYWRPEALPSTSNLSEIKLPAYSDDCWSRLNTTNPNPDAYLACDWTIDIIHKVGNAGMRQWAPHVSTFFKLQSLRETDVNTLLADYATQGKLAEETACRWLKANPVLWKGWIPPPPANYIRFLDSLSSSEPITILVFFLCAVSYILAATLLAYLIKFAKSPSVRAQSPPFMAVILFGCTVITTAIVLEPLAPSASTCTTRTWLLSLGMCTVLAAIILKTARIFWIFGNKKMRVMSGQLKTSRLMGAVAGVVLVDAILLAVWTAVAGPTQTVLDVSTTTFTYVCGATHATDGATAISIIAMVYHALLLLVAVYLSYKVRNVATEFNESRWIALSSYQILLACILVLPVVYLPINFRAQVAIKCLMVLCVVLGVMGGLVARAVVEAVLATSAGDGDPMGGAGGSAGGIGFGKVGSRTVTASMVAGKPAAKAGAGASGALLLGGDSANKSTGGLSNGGPAGPVMYGLGFSMRKLAGYLRRWTEHDVTLLGGAKPALILTDLSSKSPASKAYTVLVYARALDDTDKVKFPGCFLLAIEATKYLVQANDAAEAAQWVAAVTGTFEAANAAHSRGRITSTSGHGAHESSAAVKSVTASQIAGMVMTGGGMGNA